MEQNTLQSCSLNIAHPLKIPPQNPNEISTKESSLYGCINNKNVKSRNTKNKFDEKVKL